MRLKRLVLDGYTRLLLSGIQHLEWTPHAAYQIILGTNGSGKSSLMAEINPWPSQPSDFIKGGQSVKEYEHEDSQYILTSTFASATRHSFIKDGIEFNEGGTGAVQKELVLRHFRYDNDCHALFTGRTRFSAMNQAERRKWITRMSQADYTFALNLHDRLSKISNDMRGYLKLTKQRLHDEAASLAHMEQADGIEERVKGLQQELTDLLYTRVPSLETAVQSAERLRHAKDQVDLAGQQLLRSAQIVDLKRKDRSLTLLDERVQGITQAIQSDTSVLDRLKQEFSDLEGHLAPLLASTYKDPTEIHRALMEAQSRLDGLRATITFFPMLLTADDPLAILNASEEILPQTIALFSSLPDNSDRKYSRDNREKALTLKRAALDRITYAEAAIRILDQRQHAIEHAQSETCPSCRFVWTPGFSREELPELLHKRQAFTVEVAQCQARVAETEAFLEAMEAYMALYRQFRGMVQQYPRLTPLWDYIQTHRYDTDHPSDHQDVFIQWSQEVRAAVEVLETATAVVQLEKLIEAAQLGEQGALRQRLEALEKEIGERTHRLTTLRQQLQSETFQRGLFHALETATQLWQSAIKGLEETYQSALEASANECVESAITRTQGQLGALQHTLHAKTVLIGVIEDLKKTIAKAEVDYDAVVLLAQELSPKEGLIAEQLHGFIRCLTMQINSILSSVWTYELEVLPCGMDNGILDYQFPLQTGAAGKPTKDVSEGSESMLDMVDFAFAQTAMLYLGFEDYPLFVDELGAKFDEAHRPAINQFISRLMESQRYSQVFLISHYVAGYGSFVDSEYLVLDGRNITAPSLHNTHATLS